MSAPEHYRLFIAIRMPEQIKDAMAGAQSDLRQALPEQGVTWTKREQLHLTLKFLGNVDTQLVVALNEQLHAACQIFAPLTLRVERVGAFPNARLPRVIWAGLTDAEGQLLKLQSAVEAASQNFTVLEPEKKFTGHVTLGRAKRINWRDSQVLSGRLTDMADRFFGQWTAGEIEIMRSELAADGARHNSIGTVHLAGASLSR